MMKEEFKKSFFFRIFSSFLFTSSFLLCFIFFFLHSIFILEVLAQDIEEITYNGKSSYFNLEKARSDIFEQAIRDTSLKYIQNFIGKKKFLKNESLIQKKIIKNSKKYILFMKETQKSRTRDGIELNVLLKISLRNLKILLLDEGLFYKSEDPLIILPLISFLDKSDLKKFSWWNQDVKFSESSFLINESKIFHEHLKKSLRKNGFFSFSPVDKQFQNLIPLSVYYLDQNPRELSILIGKYFKSSLIILGDVEYVRENSEEKFFKRVSIHLEAVQPKNNQVIGRVQREKRIEIHPFENRVENIRKIYEESIQELSNQVINIWKRGRFGTILIHLDFKGEMIHSKWIQLKNILSNKIPEIKGLRERLYSSKKVSFEVDSSLASQKLAETLKSKKNLFPEFSLQVQQISETKINLKVKTNQWTLLRQP